MLTTQELEQLQSETAAKYDFSKGDRVQVHDPAWQDARGRTFGPGRNHGKAGLVIEVTDHAVGNDRLYDIEFEDDRWACHWGKELRKIANEQS